MRRLSKRSAWTMMGVIGTGLAIASVGYIQNNGTAAEFPLTVARVDRGDILQTVATTGQLTPLVSVEVSSQISGLLTEVAVDFNDQVKRGAVLARVDPSTYEQALSQAEANLAAAQAADTLAALSATRLRELRAQDLVTQQEEDAARAQRQQARAILLTARAAVQNARVNLERCTITSPIDGIVIFKQADVGKTVVSSFSAPTLFVIAQDLSHMRILAPISEVDVRKVHVGQDASFTVDALPGRHFVGRLTQIRSPYVPSEREQQSPQQSPAGTFEVVIEVDNTDLALQPSFTASVSIIVAKRENVLRVPNGALRVQLPQEIRAQPPTAPAGNTKEGTQAMVYRLPNGDRDARPETVRAQLGVSSNLVTEVIDGLREGDTVITGTAAVWQAEKRPLFR